MRRPLGWLCLMISLTGPFVVQARVAHGLALAISELGQNILESGQEIEDEAYDGRDFISIVAHSSAGIDHLHTVPLSFDLPALTLTPTTAPSNPHAGAYWRGHRKWPPPIAQRRRALLQIFLI